MPLATRNTHAVAEDEKHHFMTDQPLPDALRAAADFIESRPEWQQAGIERGDFSFNVRAWITSKDGSGVEVTISHWDKA
jgi:hypothetical protein